MSIEQALNKKLIVVSGPTAVGKTEAAIKIAQHFNAEIISADSRQIFKELNIGTAKPDEAELAAVKHHFINSHTITEKYDAAQFGSDALTLIHSLLKKLDYVVLCGGSGLYIKAVLEGFDDIPEVPEKIRQDLMASYDKYGLDWLQQKMQEYDAPHWHAIDQKNPHRLIRALEVKLGTGVSIAAFQKKNKKQHSFQIKKIGLELPREELYARIDKRMEKMIEDGLFDEAEKLYAVKNYQALQTVGYQEIFDFIEGKYGYEETIRLLKRNSRHYAKRQLTWFKRDAEIKWFNPANVNAIINFITSS